MGTVFKLNELISTLRKAINSLNINHVSVLKTIQIENYTNVGNSYSCLLSKLWNCVIWFHLAHKIYMYTAIMTTTVKYNIKY